jgi:hypothetical protein
LNSKECVHNWFNFTCYSTKSNHHSYLGPQYIILDEFIFIVMGKKYLFYTQIKLTKVEFCVEFCLIFNFFKQMNVVVSHIYTEGNQVADALANYGCNLCSISFWHVTPDFIKDSLVKNLRGLPFFRFCPWRSFGCFPFHLVSFFFLLLHLGSVKRKIFKHTHMLLCFS